MRAGITKKWLRTDWPNITIRHKDAIDDYIANADEMIENGNGLTFLGPVGTGKTLAAHHIIKSISVLEIDARAVKFSAIVKPAKDDLEKKDIEARLLLVDDLSFGTAEAQKTLFDGQLLDLVDSRYEEVRPTLITSNMSAEELANEYPRASSRLSELNSLLELDGEDKRSNATTITKGPLT
jgi:DNA replication protein DnaC